MGDSHLNGAYYGPPIPPPSKTYHSHGRGGGGGCNPFTCCCSCIANCICTCVFQLLCTLVVIAGIIILVLWLIFRPNEVKFYATDARLTEFSLDNSTLRYNLALNLTIRNPNKRIGVYYDEIEARAFYQGQRFASVELQKFFQGTKSTDSVSAEFSGQNIVLLQSDGLSTYQKDRDSGTYGIDVKLYLRTRLKFLFVRTLRMKPRIDCDLQIPLTSNGTVGTAAPYETKRCKFDWR